MESSFLTPAKTVASLQLHEGMRIADFGAGSGFFTRAAARAVGGPTGSEGVVWAVDINRELLPRIKALSLAEGLHNVEVVHGDIEAPKGSHLPAGEFDAVILANVLFASEHKEAVIAEAARVLTVNGKALIIDWVDSFGGMGPHHGHLIDEAKALHWCEAAGLSYVAHVPAGEYHWGFIVRKKRK